ncbi:MAG TPA: hypothetical protein PKA90_16295 [Ignavibacteria bacterium]|nr:hypothetical protein [Ignavibacteria bacterium]HMR41978.1 hypothetical protein [Ignavibacteria bacterium]
MNSTNTDQKNIVTSIEGAIYNLPDNSKIVKAYVPFDNFGYFIVDSVAVDSANIMRLDLQPVPSDFLFNVNYYFGNFTYIEISDTSANVNFLSIASIFDSSGNISGEIIKDNSHQVNYNETDFTCVQHLYCDRDVIISGVNEVITISGTSLLRVSYDLGKGWNVVSSRQTNYGEIFSFSGERIPGLRWNFESNKGK